MKRPRVRLHLLPLAYALMATALIGCSGSGAQAQQQQEIPAVELLEIATGLRSPTAIVPVPNASNRLFVLEQPGRIRIVEDDQLLGRPFLDLSESISSGGERGLLGLAFHPDFAENGRFFVNYTDSQGDSVVAAYTVSEDPLVADANTAQVVLGVEQPYGNHNGGGLAFGPEGYLYISLGDGGSGGDPHGHGQDPSTLLGSMLRLDVDSRSPYAIPPDNPFVGEDGAREEIWAYGLRNPWRFSFDRETGDLWIADVGQNVWEEINIQPADSTGGENYGWNVMEGAHCFEPSEGCEREGLVQPLIEYDHEQGCSVTGGYRYRGSDIPGLIGAYLFGDYCTGVIWAAIEGQDGTWDTSVVLESGLRISAFGEDTAGEIYVAAHGSGAIYRLQPER